MLEQIADEENWPKEPARLTARVHTAAEALAILDAAQHPKEQHRYSKELAAAYGLALYAGPRRKEIMRFEWPDFDLSEGSRACRDGPARVGSREQRDPLLSALGRLSSKRLGEQETLDFLRTYEMAFVRLGLSGAGEALARLGPLFPSPSERVNRELVQLLVYLDAPEVVARAMDLLGRGRGQEDELHYIFVLRNARRFSSRPR
jgi:hypothetical protein